MARFPPWSLMLIILLFSLSDFFGFRSVDALSYLAAQGFSVPPLNLSAASNKLLKRDGHIGFFTYNQTLDHSGFTPGTFKQRAYYNTEFWGGPGSPIVFFTPGENNADLYRGYLTNDTITGRLAQELKGAVVMLERM